MNKSSANKILIITHANKTIGFGHLVRQHHLSDYLQTKGFETEFILLDNLASEYCRKNNIVFHEGIKNQKLSEIVKNQKIILDVHEEKFPELKWIESSAKKLILVVSEIGKPFEYYGNHIVRIGSELDKWEETRNYFDRGVYRHIHFGRAWMIFKKEFENIEKKVGKEDKTIAIIHGGSDPHGLTFLSIQALEKCLNNYRVYVLLTDKFDDVDDIERISRNSKHEVNLILNTNSPEAYMMKSSLCLINGGNVRYEVCLTKTPFIALSFRYVQFMCTEQIAKLGIGVNLGVYNQLEHEQIAKAVDDLYNNTFLRKNMEKKMGNLFDFNGPERFLKILNKVKNV